MRPLAFGLLLLGLTTLALVGAALLSRPFIAFARVRLATRTADALLHERAATRGMPPAQEDHHGHGSKREQRCGGPDQIQAALENCVDAGYACALDRHQWNAGTLRDTQAMREQVARAYCHAYRRRIAGDHEPGNFREPFVRERLRYQQILIDHTSDTSSDEIARPTDHLDVAEQWLANRNKLVQKTDHVKTFYRVNRYPTK